MVNSSKYLYTTDQCLRLSVVYHAIYSDLYYCLLVLRLLVRCLRLFLIYVGNFPPSQLLLCRNVSVQLTTVKGIVMMKTLITYNLYKLRACLAPALAALVENLCRIWPETDRL